MLGFIIAPLVALVLKRTLLRGETPVFVMELPNYKRPTIVGVLHRMFDAGWAFARRAGTVILFSMVFVWVLLYFPHTDSNGVSYADRIAKVEAEIKEKEDAIAKYEDKDQAPEELKASLEASEDEKNAIKSEWTSGSCLGQVGRGMEPVFSPLGWDWKIGMATLA